MKHLLIALGLTALVFALYGPFKMVRVMNHNDNFWYVPTALSMVNEGNIDLDEYAPAIKELAANLRFLETYFGEEDYRIFRTGDGRVLNHYPIGTSLACVPVVGLLNLRYRHAGNPVWHSMWMALVTAKAYAAASVGLFYLLVMRLTRSPGWAIGAALVLAFTSLNFGQHAGGLWSHNPATFYVLLALLCVASGRSRHVWLAAFPLVFAVTMRPDVILLIGVLTLFVWMRHRACFWKYAAVGASGALLYIVFCKMTFGAWTQPYPGPGDFGRDTYGGLLGLLISPNRGLFVFMPLCLFSVWGMVHVWRYKSVPDVYRYLSVAVVIHWLFLAVWPMWWAGWSFGPRLFCTMIPIWMLLILPLRDALRKMPVAAAVAACIGWGGFVQARCLTDQDVHLWNAMPVDINDYPQRNWDWGDLQITRGMGGEYGVDLPRKRKVTDFK